MRLSLQRNHAAITSPPPTTCDQVSDSPRKRAAHSVAITGSMVAEMVEESRRPDLPTSEQQPDAKNNLKEHDGHKADRNQPHIGADQS